MEALADSGVAASYSSFRFSEALRIFARGIRSARFLLNTEWCVKNGKSGEWLAESATLSREVFPHGPLYKTECVAGSTGQRNMII